MKISIVMATWNRADLIHIPIESVLSQTYKNWEFLIMDDGSTDNTSEIVRKYKDKRIKYFQLEKQPYYTVVRNKGIDESTGELLAFRDSDGAWKETFLEEMSKPFRNEDVILSYCGREMFKNINLKDINFRSINTLTPEMIVRPQPYRGRDSISNVVDVGDLMVRKLPDVKFSEDKDLRGYCSDAKLVDFLEVKYPLMKIISIDKILHYYFYKHGGSVENMTDTKLRYRNEGKHDNDLEETWKF